MNEVEEALHDAAQMGYKAEENGKKLEDVLDDIKVSDGETA